MKLLISAILSVLLAVAAGPAAAAGASAKAPAAPQLNVYLYSAAGKTVELFVVDFTLEGKRNEPVQLFNEARAQCKGLGFVTVRRTEVIPAVLRVGGQDLSGSLLRYTCTNSF